MTKLVVNESLREHLPTLTEQIEFCDETGKTLGHFLPAEVYKQFLLAWADANITEEELERRRREPRGHTLAEIWKGLGQS